MKLYETLDNSSQNAHGFLIKHMKEASDFTKNICFVVLQV